jgi:proline iminopeptidase
MTTATRSLCALLMIAVCSLPAAVQGASIAAASQPLEQREGYVDTGSAMIYYKSIGTGPALMVLHGGPGSTHDYFLPYLLPLARHHRLVFIDERGSGHSQQLHPAQYTLQGMADDVEAVRVALGLGRMDLLGHSFGGILAQAVAIRYPAGVRRLILSNTGSSAEFINADFKRIMNALDPALRARIRAIEARGIIGADGAQLPEYRKLADQAEAPYNYSVRMPPWDSKGQGMGWDVLNEMWGAKSDFHIDGSLKGFDLTPDLKKLDIRALVIYGDHDLLSDATARQSHEALRNSIMIKVPHSAHMTFVDQNKAYIDAVNRFLESE